MEPSGEEGVLTTEPLRFAGSNLTLNADATQGSIAVEVLDVNGEPVEGCSLGDAIPVTDDSFRCEVVWKGGRRLTMECGDGDERTDYEPALRWPRRLRFHIRNAKLFSFRVY